MRHSRRRASSPSWARGSGGISAIGPRSRRATRRRRRVRPSRPPRRTPVRAADVGGGGIASSTCRRRISCGASPARSASRRIATCWAVASTPRDGGCWRENPSRRWRRAWASTIRRTSPGTSSATSARRRLATPARHRRSVLGARRLWKASHVSDKPDLSLEADDLSGDPMVQFRRWFEDAEADGIHLANAIALATADASGKPVGSTRPAPRVRRARIRLLHEPREPEGAPARREPRRRVRTPLEGARPAGVRHGLGRTHDGRRIRRVLREPPPRGADRRLGVTTEHGPRPRGTN